MICQKETSLKGEFLVAEVEQVLEGGSKEIDNHRIVIALGSKPANEGNPYATRKGLVDLGFVLKLGMLRLHGLEFDGDFLAGDDVDPEVDIP